MPDPRIPFTSHPDTTSRGRAAEEAAVAWLVRQGYRVVERNVRTQAGEIDLVAVADDPRVGEVLCFLEIKARLDTRYGPAIAAIGRRKRARLGRAALCYVARTGWQGPCRFDVLGLEPGEAGWEYDLVQGAFELGE